MTDYWPINPYNERPIHPFPLPDIVFQSVGKDSRWFAKLDAFLHGYYQILLAPKCQKLTQGRFYYKVAPMGLNPSSDWWCRKSDEAVASLSGVLKLVDDILVHAPSLVALWGQIRHVLQRCRAHGIVLNKSKFENRVPGLFHRPQCYRRILWDDGWGQACCTAMDVSFNDALTHC